MYERILVATDGSDAAKQIIEEALGLAELSNATIHALYVVDNQDYNTLPESKWLTLDEELTEQGQQAVAAVRDRATKRGVDVETAVETGIPHEELLMYAEEHDIDLIVMGTHGRSGLNHFLIGSVAEKVIRSATIPVHIVRIVNTAAQVGKTSQTRS